MLLDNSNPSYLLAHRKLAWIPTNETVITNVTGKVTHPTYAGSFFGRIVIDNFHMIGAIHSSNKLCYQVNATSFKCVGTDFEVITCSP
jgi:hypothetical protein